MTDDFSFNEAQTMTFFSRGKFDFNLKIKFNMYFRLLLTSGSDNVNFLSNWKEKIDFSGKMNQKYH